MKIFLLLISSVIHGTHSLNFVFDYFTRIKTVRHVVLFSCEPTLNLRVQFNEIQIFTRVFDQQNEDLNITDVLTPDASVPWGVYLDVDCHLAILEQASNWEYFNTSYFWLVKGPSIQILDNIFHIGLNAQLTFIENGTLIDVFSYGRHLEFNLTCKPFGYLDEKEGELKIFHEFPQLYRKNYRGNFHQLTLRQGVVVC